VSLPWSLRFGFAIRKIGAENKFERHALGAGDHAFLQSGNLPGLPLRWLGGGQLTDDLGAFGFQFKSGIQHQHVRAAGEQRPGAGDARRTGTDDTVHNFSLPGNAVAEWKQNLVRVQAYSKTKSGAAFPHSAC